MSRHKWIATFLVTASILAQLTLTAIPAQAAGCSTGDIQGVAPNNCVLGLSDEGMVDPVKLNPRLDKCVVTTNGVSSGMGLDYLRYFATSTIEPDGSLVAGSPLSFEISIRQACRAWVGAYKMHGWERLVLNY